MQEADWSGHMLTGCKRIRQEFFEGEPAKFQATIELPCEFKVFVFMLKCSLQHCFLCPSRHTHTQHHSHESCHEHRLQTSPRYHWICLQIVSICQSLLCLLLASLWLNSAMQKQTLSGPAKKLGVLFLACSLIETAA